MANYIIIGADGVERGPVSTEQIRNWVAEKRLGPQTKAKVEGAADWVLLGQLPEFADILSSSPPPLPPGALASPSKMSTMAVLSLVFGLLGIVTCITSILGLIFGITALVKISNSKGALRGWGLALAGTIISALAVLIGPAMLLPALAAAKHKAEMISCLNNERQLALAAKLYASEHNNQLPPAATWCDVIHIPSEKILKCSAANSHNRCDYAFNSKLGDMDQSKVAPDTVMFFESDGGWDANGGPELIIGQPRHNFYAIVFADGHGEFITQARLSTLRWDP